jgi:hypothetical protein
MYSFRMLPLIKVAFLSKSSQIIFLHVLSVQDIFPKTYQPKYLSSWVTNHTKTEQTIGRDSKRYSRTVIEGAKQSHLL